MGRVLGAGAGLLWKRLKSRPKTASAAAPAAKRKPTSIAASLGTGAGRAYLRLKGKPGRNTRVKRGLRSGAKAFWQPVAATLRVLFLEVSGFLFICFTVFIGGALYGEYKKFANHQSSVERVVLAGVVGTMFLYFGMSSFWRARHKRTRT